MTNRLLSVALVAAIASPLAAQRNNQSDVSGVSVTGSAIVAGNFVAPAIPRAVQVTNERDRRSPLTACARSA